MPTSYEIYTQQVTEAYAPLKDDPEREGELLERIQFGELCKDDDAILPDDLIATMRDASAAMDEITNAYLPLVVSIARRYAFDSEELMEFVQEGNLVLVEIAKSHAPDADISFSARLVFKIKEHLQHLIPRDRTIRPSSYISRHIGKVVGITDDLARECGEEPSPEDIIARGEEIGLRAATVQAVMKYLATQAKPEALNAEYVLREDDETAIRYRQVIDRDSIIRAFNEVGLTIEERTILALAFGLDGKPNMTLKEIGVMYDRSKSWGPYMQKMALAKLRTSQGLVSAYGAIDAPQRREDPGVAEDILAFRQWLFDNFSLLEERYQLLVSMRYGLGEGNITYKLKEISAEVGIGVPTISHHLKRAIESLRNNPDSTDFDSYVS